MELAGYVSAFIGNFIASSTVVLPVPFYLIYTYLAIQLNPILLSFFSAIGASLGEMVGYAFGYAGSDLLDKNKYTRFAKKWFKKNGALTIFIFAATPLPDDIIGIIAGAAKYNKSKFFVASFLGKLLLFFLLALIVRYSYAGLLNFFH